MHRRPNNESQLKTCCHKSCRARPVQLLIGHSEHFVPRRGQEEVTSPPLAPSDLATVHNVMLIDVVGSDTSADLEGCSSSSDGVKHEGHAQKHFGN